MIFPITAHYFSKGIGKIPHPTACNRRINALMLAILHFTALITHPISLVLISYNHKIYKKSNVLDVLIALVVAPLFLLLGTFRYLLGTIFPKIVYKSSRDRTLETA